MYDLFKKFNLFEKIMFIILQTSACALGFLLLAMLGTLNVWWVIGTAIVCVVSGYSLQISYNRRLNGRDRINFMFSPSFTFGKKTWRL